MSVSDRSRAEVDAALDDLEREYGAFEVVEQESTLSPEAYRQTVNRFDGEGVVGGAGAWVTDDHDRVLLVRPRDADAWVDPGDGQRAGESLAETAVRAVRDQTGLEAVVDDVLRAEVYAYRAEGRDWPTVHALNVTFRGRAEGRPDPGEGIGATDWWRDSPNRVGYEAMLEFPFPAVEES